MKEMVYIQHGSENEEENVKKKEQHTWKKELWCWALILPSIFSEVGLHSRLLGVNAALGYWTSNAVLTQYSHLFPLAHVLFPLQTLVLCPCV